MWILQRILKTNHQSYLKDLLREILYRKRIVFSSEKTEVIFNNLFRFSFAFYIFFSYICTMLRNPIREKHDSVAQPVEQYTFNVWVLGSNPSGITKKLH